MPEGPEVRREADAIARALVGEVLAKAEYRLPALARRAKDLVGARVTSVAAHGKTMRIAFDRGLVHLSHHQLYGRWSVTGAERGQDSERAVRVVLGSARKTAILTSVTAIALVDAATADRHPLLARLGPDALDRTTTATLVAARLADVRFARTTLAHLLLDQSFVAGLGNYLRSDILHVAGLRANLRPADLDADRLQRLAAAIVTLPRRSYRSNGITNDPSLARALARRGVPWSMRRFAVYGREGEPCWTCGDPVRREDAAGRGWFFCPRCQPSARVGKRTGAAGARPRKRQ